jgi:hypothetical protein
MTKASKVEMKVNYAIINFKKEKLFVIVGRIVIKKRNGINKKINDVLLSTLYVL